MRRAIICIRPASLLGRDDPCTTEWAAPPTVWNGIPSTMTPPAIHEKYRPGIALIRRISHFPPCPVGHGSHVSTTGSGGTIPGAYALYHGASWRTRPASRTHAGSLRPGLPAGGPVLRNHPDAQTGSSHQPTGRRVSCCSWGNGRNMFPIRWAPRPRWPLATSCPRTTYGACAIMRMSSNRPIRTSYHATQMARGVHPHH